MQIASPITIATASSPYSARDANDVVSPTKLLELARNRFEVAYATLRIGGDASVPTSDVTVLALNQVAAGVASLRSVLVPSAPFELRERAATSISNAAVATDLLRRYHAAAVEFDGHPPTRDQLDPVIRMTIDAARARLQLIIGSLH
jgi:hypothetical protein